MSKASRINIKILFLLTVAAVAGSGFAGTPVDLRYIRVNGNDFGYYDPLEKKLVIPPMFSSAWDFSPNGLAVAQKKDGVWGFINSKGDMVLPTSFDYLFGFSKNGLAGVKKDKKWGYINNKGDTVCIVTGKQIGRAHV